MIVIYIENLILFSSSNYLLSMGAAAGLVALFSTGK
jgi:hypothetical protein